MQSAILALDVSRSMCSTDISPSRPQAAEAAALSFIQRQKAGKQLGIVAFAGFAEVVQAPTADRAGLQEAVESLVTARRTAVGNGIHKSPDAVAEIDENVAASVTGASPGVEPTPVPKGAFAPDIIVLLTDGASNAGILPLDAAQQAVDRGVRVSIPSGSARRTGQVRLAAGHARVSACSTLVSNLAEAWGLAGVFAAGLTRRR